MSGFIKISLRDTDGITTKILNVKDVKVLFSNIGNIFNKNNIKDKISKIQLDKNSLYEIDYLKKEYKCPFYYGYIFIDEINNKLFYLNNFDSISYFFPHDFDKKEQIKLKNFNYMVSTKTGKLDIREHYLNIKPLSDYYRLNKSIPFIDNIYLIKENKYLNGLIDMETIINYIISSSNDLFDIEPILRIDWKDWDVLESDYSYKESLSLYKYLKEEYLLNENEDKEWQKILIELSN